MGYATADGESHDAELPVMRPVGIFAPRTATAHEVFYKSISEWPNSWDREFLEVLFIEKEVKLITIPEALRDEIKLRPGAVGA